MLPKYAVIGVHHEGAGTGLRDRSVSWRRAGAHFGGGTGPGFRLATTSEVSTSNELRRHSASFDRGKPRTLTNSPYFGQPYHRNRISSGVGGDRSRFGSAQNYIGA